jgi:hypothetical protein
MAAYETNRMIHNPARLVLTKLPFRPGQQVKIVIVPEPEENRAELVRRWQALFAKTQSLPQAQTITDEDIAAEIAAYRAGP